MVTDLFGQWAPIADYSFGDLDGDGAMDALSVYYNAVPTSAGGFTGFGFRTSMLAAFGDGSGFIAAGDEIPVNLSAMDLFGNPATAPTPVVLDVNLDGAAEILYAKPGHDLFGMPTWNQLQIIINPGGGSRKAGEWFKMPLGDFDFAQAAVVDFDGDGQLELANPSRFLKPAVTGPIASPRFDFAGRVPVERLELTAFRDFDGDGDADLLWWDPQAGTFHLVKNTIVDERSAIGRELRGLGISGAFSNPGEDADGDGRSNVRELLEGTDPLVADDVPAVPQAAVVVDVSSRANLRIRALAGAEAFGISQQVQWSTDLEQWHPLEVPMVVDGPRDGLWQWMSAELPADGDAAFFRLVSTHPAVE